MVIQHNLTAMNSNRMLGVTTKSQAKSTEKLSSGYKINRAADDAAGLSISEKMRKQIRGLTQASANAQDGISMVQTAEGALNEVQDMLQRMNELAVKAANGTLSSDDRGYIQNEVDQIMSEIDRVAQTTKFNETYLLDSKYSLGALEDGFYGKIDESIVGTNADLLTHHMLGVYDGSALTPITGDTVIHGNYGANSSVTAGSNYSAGFLDLSSVTSKADVEKLMGSGISATCCGCTKFYSIKFVDNGADLGLNDGFKVIGNAKGGDTLWIDVSNCNNGSDVVKAVMTAYAKYNGDSTYTGTGKAAYNMGDAHANGTLVTSYGASASWHHVGIGGNVDTAQLVFFDTVSTTPQTTQEEGYDGYGGFANGYVGKAQPIIMEEKEISLHVGADSDSNNKINVKLGNISTAKLGLAGYEYNWRNETVEWKNKADVTTAATATKCIDAIKTAIQEVSTQRSAFGAVQNRLEHTINNLDNVVENTTAAESQIRDTDMASEMVKFSNNNILAQAGQSMLAQANQVNQGILSLLR